MRYSALAVAAFAATTAAHGNGTLAPTPEYPVTGDSVSVSLRDSQWPPFTPTINYAKQGTTLTFDFDVESNGFNSTRPDFGMVPVVLGEMLPGAYTAHARFSDLSNPSAPPQITTSYFTVAAPWMPGAYAVPGSPGAYQPWNALVASSHYVYTSSVTVTVTPPVVRVSFEYDPAAPTGNGIPALSGTAAWASIAVQGLPAGDWTLEANGTPRGGGNALQYRKTITVQRKSPVVEFYAESTGHYFVTAGPGEIAMLDSGQSPGWRRTGQRWDAFLRAEDAAPGAVPVCRFYASGPNSHFYTADAGECQWLRNLEAEQRAAMGKQFGGWAYEGTAFYALVPINGQCPAGTEPVARFYNNRAAQNDSNHRFPITAEVARAMAFSWKSEGTGFCSPR